MNDCPFCNASEIKKRILRETENVRVIFSNPRLLKGHLLVTPKRHVEQPWDLTEAELKEIFLHIHALQKQITNVLGTGCDIRQNYRPFMQQGRLKVNHVHFHLLPRTLRDDLYERSMKFESDIFTDLTEAELKEVKSALQN